MASFATDDLSPDLSKKRGLPEVPRDTTREIFETVVFVIVLVLMLKLFVAEAFVIPTGSMASTLWGDQVRCTCRDCGHKFPINSSDGGKRGEVSDYQCENCGFIFSRWFDEKFADEKRQLTNEAWRRFSQDDLNNDLASTFLSSSKVSSGDRVLVSKYEYHFQDPKRFDVPVFKYPRAPYSKEERSGMNYIKRLVGLGGETIAVFDGDLYQTRDLTYEHISPEDRPQRELDAWLPRYMYPDDAEAAKYFHQGKFEMVRKKPAEILAMRRIVFDLNKQPRSITDPVRRMRWHPQQAGSGWQMEEAGFKHNGGETAWMTYQHIDPWNKNAIVPYYVVDYLGYNTRPPGRDDRDALQPNQLFMNLGRPREGVFQFEPGLLSHWVSDLAVDCSVEVPSEKEAVVLELAKGRDRFRAEFVGGQCRLSRVTTSDAGEESIKEMGSHPTKITSGGTYALRLANFDARLTVWVDDKPLAFGKDQTDYQPADPTVAFTPFEANDLMQPARIGARGDVKVSKVSLWRDLQYRCGWYQMQSRGDEDEVKAIAREWKKLPDCSDLQTYYVQPGHYLMFGDNVNSSADSRSWGLVPNRLMLGRAVVVYWPFSRMGVIE